MMTFFVILWSFLCHYLHLSYPFPPTATPLIQFLLHPNLSKWNNLPISSNPGFPASKSSYAPSDRLIFLKQINSSSVLGTNWSLICKALHNMNLPCLPNLSPTMLHVNHSSQQLLYPFANGCLYSHHFHFISVVAHQYLCGSFRSASSAVPLWRLLSFKQTWAPFLFVSFFLIFLSLFCIQFLCILYLSYITRPCFEIYRTFSSFPFRL